MQSWSGEETSPWGIGLIPALVLPALGPPASLHVPWAIFPLLLHTTPHGHSPSPPFSMHAPTSMVRLLSVGVHGKFLRIPGLGCALPPAFKRPSAVIPQTCPSIQHCTLYLAVPRARWVAHFSHPSHPHAPPCPQPISGWFSKCQALAIPGPSTSRSSTPGNNRVWLEHSRTPRSNTARCSSVPWHTFPPLLGPRWPLLFTRGPRSSKPPSETAPPHPPQVSLRMPSLHVWSPGRH